MKTKSMYVSIALLLGFAMGSLISFENGIYALPVLLAMLVYSLTTAHRLEWQEQRFKARLNKYFYQ